MPGQQIRPAQEVESAEWWLKRSAELADPITVVLIGGEKPLGMAMTGNREPPLYVDFRRQELMAVVVSTLTEWLQDPNRTVAGHDLKEILRLALPLGQPRARLLDAMLLSYVLRPSARGHGLEEQSLERLGVSATKIEELGWAKDQVPLPGDETLLTLAGERVELTRRLVAAMLAELGAGRLADVYSEIEAPLLPVLVQMEEAGVLLDREFLARMSSELETELDALQLEIHELAGEKFNINSPQQLGVILFEKLGLPVLKKTRKTKSYSTSAEILQKLSDEGHLLPGLLLRYRELNKLKSTYVDALPELVGDDGRVHTRFYQAVAATGRLSSANPNLQNIPVRTKVGQRIRRGFVAPHGARLLVADYNQIELRVLAHISQDEVLIEAFRSGEDIHRMTAAAVFGVAPELVTTDQRRAAKTINFGIIYGISAFGLGRNLGIRPAEAEIFIRAYFERYSGVQRYIDETLAAVQEHGKVETLYGRVRWLPDVRSSNHNLRENARRMAINARIQGTAADLMKKAMIEVHRRLREQRVAARLLLTVHDELILEVPEVEVGAVSKIVRQGMEGVADLAVPLAVDLDVGDSWYDAKS